MTTRLLTEDGVVVFASHDQNYPWHFQELPRPVGRYVSRCVIPGNLLNAGYYLISPGADVPCVEVIFFEELTLGFHVEQTGAAASRYPEKVPGVICPVLEWQLDKLEVTLP